MEFTVIFLSIILSRSLSVSMAIRFPLCNVRSKCECVHTMCVGMVLVVRPYVLPLITFNQLMCNITVSFIYPINSCTIHNERTLQFQRMSCLVYAIEHIVTEATEIEAVQSIFLSC